MARKGLGRLGSAQTARLAQLVALVRRRLGCAAKAARGGAGGGSPECAGNGAPVPDSRRGLAGEVEGASPILMEGSRGSWRRRVVLSTGMGGRRRRR